MLIRKGPRGGRALGSRGAAAQKAQLGACLLPREGGRPQCPGVPEGAAWSQQRVNGVVSSSRKSTAGGSRHATWVRLRGASPGDFPSSLSLSGSTCIRQGDREGSLQLRCKDRVEI